jgi:hypothetical protein
MGMDCELGERQRHPTTENHTRLMYDLQVLLAANCHMPGRKSKHPHVHARAGKPKSVQELSPRAKRAKSSSASRKLILQLPLLLLDRWVQMSRTGVKEPLYPFHYQPGNRAAL